MLLSVGLPRLKMRFPELFTVGAFVKRTKLGGMRRVFGVAGVPTVGVSLALHFTR